MTATTTRRITVAALVIAATAFAGVAGAAPEDKVLLCHGTASEPNPYALISVDASALNGHFDGTAPGHGPNNHPDLYPSANGTCPTTPPGGEGGGE
jgi:hypothetical protein